MALGERIISQPYAKGKQGNLVPSPQLARRNPEEAIRRAERAIAAGSVAEHMWCACWPTRWQATSASRTTLPCSAMLERTPGDGWHLWS